MHSDSIDKAYYFYTGNFEVLVDDKMISARAEDALFIPKKSVTKINNIGSEDAELFMFLPEGTIDELRFNLPDKEVCDFKGKLNKLVKASEIPKEYWKGKLPEGSDAPVWWKNLIDTDSMVLGITNIHQHHEVSSHYHEETELVIFSHGSGITRIDENSYHPINKFTFIHPPKWSIHHTISLNDKHLGEIYFFPSGPFSTIKYLYR